MHALIMAAALAAAAPAHPAASRLGDWGPVASGDLTGIVRDSAGGQGLAGGDVIVSRDGRIIARSQTDPTGRFRIHNLPDGPYDVEVRLVGFRPVVSHVTIEGSRETDVSVALAPSVAQLQELETTAPGAGGGRHAHRQSGVQAERLSRRPHTDHLSDRAAVHRGRRSRTHRRGPHPRPARRVHLLHRRRPGAARDLRQPERGLRSPMW